MARAKSQYQCTQCGGLQPRWAGQCPQCMAWNTLEETRAEAATGASRHAGLAAAGRVQALAEIHGRAEPRLPSGLDEFDRVLGGGLVDGGVLLLGGDPGIGKSTLLLQALCRLAAQGTVCLYVSGEESAEQVALRARRLQLEPGKLQLLPEINLEKIVAAIATVKPRVVVIDSIQTLYSSELASAPGSVSQVRECAAQLTRVAKQGGPTVVLVGHVTKEGTLAGPRVLEHMVDTVLYFEGETGSSYRLIRAVKNRYGAVNELGVFAMTERGLKGVSNPSALFLSQHAQPVPGSCIAVTQEGTRPLLVEIQALADTASMPTPRRLCVGLDANRLAMLLAVLHRHAGVMCSDQDVFLNAVGGVRIGEPAADLAVLLAVVSSLRNRPLDAKLVVFGEIGLAGEVRPAPRGQERLREAARLGFTHALIPRANAPRQAWDGIRLLAVDRVEQALEAAWQ
ncbi:MAG: DNA repair protein RadA [Rhodocyclaceae bacterium]|nr:DNA repair protein RadA [Rhodocyclaceae bacterium]